MFEVKWLKIKELEGPKINFASNHIFLSISPPFFWILIKPRSKKYCKSKHCSQFLVDLLEHVLTSYFLSTFWSLVATILDISGQMRNMGKKCFLCERIEIPPPGYIASKKPSLVRVKRPYSILNLFMPVRLIMQLCKKMYVH